MKPQIKQLHTETHTATHQAEAAWKWHVLRSVQVQSSSDWEPSLSLLLSPSSSLSSLPPLWHVVFNNSDGPGLLAACAGSGSGSASISDNDSDDDVAGSLAIYPAMHIKPHDLYLPHCVRPHCVCLRCASCESASPHDNVNDDDDDDDCQFALCRQFALCLSLSALHSLAHSHSLTSISVCVCVDMWEFNFSLVQFELILFL